jgi:hypothetical protein
VVRIRRSSVLLVFATVGAVVACEGQSASSRRNESDAGAPSAGEDGTSGAAGASTGGVGATAGASTSGTGTGGRGRGGEAGSAQGGGGAQSGEGGEAGATGGAAGTGAGLGGTNGGNAGSSGFGGAAGTSGSSGAGVAGAAGGPCGEPNALCCPTTVECNSPETTCLEVPGPILERRCLPCGVPGAPCCESSVNHDQSSRYCDGGCCVWQTTTTIRPAHWHCVAPGADCPAGGACQTDGSCTDCGGIGKACCPFPALPPNPGGWCAVPGTTCAYDIEPLECRSCGELDEPCCVANEQLFPGFLCRSPLSCSTERVCRPR